VSTLVKAFIHGSGTHLVFFAGALRTLSKNMRLVQRPGLSQARVRPLVVGLLLQTSPETLSAQSTMLLLRPHKVLPMSTHRSRSLQGLLACI
jgi:hypothetical protein